MRVVADAALRRPEHGRVLDAVRGNTPTSPSRSGSARRRRRPAPDSGAARPRPARRQRARAPARTARARFARAARPTRASSVPPPRPWQRSVGRTRRTGPDAPSAQGDRRALAARVWERGPGAAPAAGTAQANQLRFGREARRDHRPRARRSRLRRRRQRAAPRKRRGPTRFAQASRPGGRRSGRSQPMRPGDHGARSDARRPRSAIGEASKPRRRSSRTCAAPCLRTRPKEPRQGGGGCVPRRRAGGQRRSRDRTRGPPRGAGLAEIVAELSGLATNLQTTVESGRTLVTELTELGGAMKDAFENADSCQELREPE